MCNCLDALKKSLVLRSLLSPPAATRRRRWTTISPVSMQEDVYQHATVTLKLAPLLFYNMGLYLEPRSLVVGLHRNPPPAP